jgi:Uma2 family endonuclease
MIADRKMANMNLAFPDDISFTEQALLQYIHQIHPELRSRNEILFEVLYQQLPDKQKADIVKGKIEIHNCPAMPEHDSLNAMLYQLLQHYSERFPQTGFPFGPMTIVQIPPASPNDPPTGREPDIFWVANNDLPLVKGAKFTGRPTLIIEILASDPQERDRDLSIKPIEYARLGVIEYWIFDIWGNETKFGILNGSSYLWQDWPVGADPQIASITIPGFYIQKSWITLTNGHFPSVQL